VLCLGGSDLVMAGLNLGWCWSICSDGQ
jgi:hypothetical protein